MAPYPASRFPDEAHPLPGAVGTRPDDALLLGLLAYVSGPRRAHEEGPWAVLAHVIMRECDDPWSDDEVRAELRRRARRTSRLRSRHPLARGP